MKERKVMGVGLNCAPRQNSYVKVLTPCFLECDFGDQFVKEVIKLK